MTVESAAPAARPDLTYCRQLDRLAHDVIRTSVACMKGDRAARNRVFLVLLVAYSAMFVVGLVAFAAALVKGLMADSTGDALTVTAFAGLSGASFVSLVMIKPLQTLRRNSIFLTWLNVATTTYWTRHYYLNKRGLLDHELEVVTRETLRHLHDLLVDVDREPPVEEVADSGGAVAELHRHRAVADARHS
jgi:hypothetical protein